jgi:hypothetical protein
VSLLAPIAKLEARGLAGMAKDGDAGLYEKAAGMGNDCLQPKCNLCNRVQPRFQPNPPLVDRFLC